MSKELDIKIKDICRQLDNNLFLTKEKEAQLYIELSQLVRDKERYDETIQREKDLDKAKWKED